MLVVLKKLMLSLDEYLRKFKGICDNLVAINQPMLDLDKVFQLAHGLGLKDENFRLVMLTKLPFPSFNEFVLAFQGHEQSLEASKEEEKHYVDDAQAFFGQCGRGHNNRGGRNFNSRECGFTSAESHGNYSSLNGSSRRSFGNSFKKLSNFVDQSHVQQQFDKSKIMCQIYRCYNNFVLNCWNRFYHTFQPDNVPHALAALTMHDYYNTSFYIDSGVSSHMTNDPDNLSTISLYNRTDLIYVDDGEGLPISHTGYLHCGD